MDFRSLGSVGFLHHLPDPGDAVPWEMVGIQQQALRSSSARTVLDGFFF